MLKSIGTGLLLSAAFASVTYAKDMFDVYGTKGTAAVRLHADIHSQYNDGFIRGASNFGNGQWDIEPEVPCGNSERYFEVWSRLSTISPPGIAFQQMKFGFTLKDETDVKGAYFQRAVKGTLKRSSHFKGEDFGVRIHLLCK